MGQQVLTEAQTLPISGRIARIEVAIGEVLVIPPFVENPDEDSQPLDYEIAQAGDHVDCKDTAGISLYAPRSASVNIVEAQTVRDEVAAAAIAEEEAKRLAPPEPEKPKRKRAKKKSASRGDSGGDSGSYESRTTTELRDLARGRGIKGFSRMKKPALIKALRA